MCGETKKGTLALGHMFVYVCMCGGTRVGGGGGDGDRNQCYITNLRSLNPGGANHMLRCGRSEGARSQFLLAFAHARAPASLLPSRLCTRSALGCRVVLNSADQPG